MEPNLNSPYHPTNWSIRFLCDCKKENKEIRIHQGLAHQISTRGVHILSDHHICLQKKVAMQLMIPALQDGHPQQVIKIIGHSMDTVAKGDSFLTEIEFKHFEEDGRQILEKNLHQRFGSKPLTRVAQRA